MIELNVWLTSPENTIKPAGQIVVAAPEISRGGSVQGQLC